MRSPPSFIYGGYNRQMNTEYSDVHVLSLPGFRWTTASGSTSVDRQRRDHACEVIGERHLVSWGGAKEEAGRVSWEIVDAFPQGIGLFDMSTFEWTEEYKAGAAAYERHEKIGEWYAEG